jgi:hypothetical protein
LGDKRTYRRFAIRGEARFGWEDVHGQSCVGMGVTRDMGRAGTFVESSTVPPLSTSVHMIVQLRASWPSGLQASFAGNGIVRHVQFSGNHPVGFAASVAFRTEAAPEKLSGSWR